MPKPNQKRIEERTMSRKQAGKLYIPEGLTTGYVPPTPQNTISDEELERLLTELLSGQQGYGKNYGKSLRPETP
ncbi:hypothetical protein SEA_ATUIN_38 [Arthrobacter phage Atuin]|nr:hypothetical protein SEA_ATUIN_137 [Arthrobacter phage Atuin]